MADREPIDFFTVNHQHIPIFEGESKQDAYNRAVAKHNEDTKNRQIAKNKEEADRLNGKTKPKNDQKKPNNREKQNKSKQNNNQEKNLNIYRKGLPRNLPLKNIKAEDANKTTDVSVLRKDKGKISGGNNKIQDGKPIKGTKVFTFKEGTEITKVAAFAGKGCYKAYEKAPKFAEKYGGKVEDWQHCVGYATLTDGKRTFVKEVHWSQLENGVMLEAFIKFNDKKGGKK